VYAAQQNHSSTWKNYPDGYDSDHRAIARGHRLSNRRGAVAGRGTNRQVSGTHGRPTEPTRSVGRLRTGRRSGATRRAGPDQRRISGRGGAGDDPEGQPGTGDRARPGLTLALRGITAGHSRQPLRLQHHTTDGCAADHNSLRPRLRNSFGCNSTGDRVVIRKTQAGSISAMDIRPESKLSRFGADRKPPWVARCGETSRSHQFLGSPVQRIIHEELPVTTHHTRDIPHS
jgi:hypothetical protein